MRRDGLRKSAGKGSFIATFINHDQNEIKFASGSTIVLLWILAGFRCPCPTFENRLALPAINRVLIYWSFRLGGSDPVSIDVFMMPTKEVKIYIAEDHLISRMGLRMLLEKTSYFSVVGEAEDGEVALQQIMELQPEVVMMDLDLPVVNGIEATAQIKASLPQTKVLIFTAATDDESIFAALRAGADGYCLKNNISDELLASAIDSVLKGAAWLDPGIAHKVLRVQANQAQAPQNSLTDSKLKLLALISEGKSADEIASELDVNDVLVKGLLNELLIQLKGGSTAVWNKADSVLSEKGLGPGCIVGSHYKIEEKLGYGGMGSVFKARHLHIERTVALKTMHGHHVTDPSTMARFKSEAQANISVSHPNLVTIYDFGIIDEKIPYIVMEFLEGYNLNELLEQTSNIRGKVAKHIFMQVCDALTAVHSKGIVHRDLKPSNVMLIETDDNPYFVKLVDFGIAKSLSTGRKIDLTSTGEAIGSPPFMSPEQCQSSEVDHRSDLYSLGCMMYEAYTGERPFQSEHPWEIMMKHVKERPSTQPFEAANVSAPIVDLTLRLLNKDPDDRPSTAEEVRAILSAT